MSTRPVLSAVGPLLASLAFATVALTPPSALAAPAPTMILKVGSSCPYRYSSSGAYCVPDSMSSAFTILKVGSSCPYGYSTSMSAYCQADSASTHYAMPKVGSFCPNGFSTSMWTYCLAE